MNEANSYMLMYFARAIKFNQMMVMSQENQAIVMSMMTKEYSRNGIDKEFRESKIFKEEMAGVLWEFNNMFSGWLDIEQECFTYSTKDLFYYLKNRRKLSRIHYLLLFAIFLNLHKLVSRVNFIVDIGTMESQKYIKVSRQKTTTTTTNKVQSDLKRQDSSSAANNKYQYGLQKKGNSDKKRLFKDYFG